MPDRSSQHEAADCLQRVLQAQPNHAEAWGNLGGALQQQGKLEAAIAHYQKAIELLTRTFADAYQNLSVALQALDRLEEAVQICDRLIGLRPELPDVHYNRGYMLRRLGQVEAAIVSYRRAIELKPDFVMAHKNLGHALLLTGDLPNGFAEYEWRWRQEGWTTRPFAQPLWDGSPLEGKTILLHAEQGMGDTMQFIRYAKQVKQLGGQVMVECPEPLIRLLGKRARDRSPDHPGTPPPQLRCPRPSSQPAPHPRYDARDRPSRNSLSSPPHLPTSPSPHLPIPPPQDRHHLDRQPEP